jgi:uncharacterized protein (TIRG00374 family)
LLEESNQGLSGLGRWWTADKERKISKLLGSSITGDGSINLNFARKARLWLGLTLGVIALWLSLRGVRLADALKTALQADYLFIALALGTVMGTTVGKTARWRLLLHGHRSDLRLGRLLSALLVGQLINAVLPGRLGEIARAYLIGEREDVSKVTALATVVVEKFLDSTILLLLLAGLALAIPLPVWLRDSVPLLSLGVVTLFVLLLIAAIQKKKPRHWLDRTVTPLPERWRAGLVRNLDRATDGLSLLRQPAVLCSALILSVLIWIAAAFTNYLAMRALRIDLPLTASVLVLSSVHAGVVLSPTPGQVGVFHYLCILSLSLFGVDQSLALSYSLVLHLIVYAPIALLGSLSLWKASYDQQIWRGETTKPDTETMEECTFQL